MKILLLAAEVGPYVSVGGLSQVLYFLPRALSKLGEDVRTFTPKFGTMDKTSPGKKGWNLKMEAKGLRIPINENLSKNDLICNVRSYQKNSKSIKTYFLENREYYELRENVFGYKDDHIRFDLLCKGCLEWLLVQKAKKGMWFPDVIHCNDWHASYFVELARTNSRYQKILNKIPIVLTVHNFMFQGNFEFKYCAKADVDDGSKPLASLIDPRLQKQNALLRGIKYADAITTVSSTHALEVLTEEYAEGLQELLLSERSKLTGILNGLDTNEFNPARDPMVLKHFDNKSFRKARKMNKAFLQIEFKLPVDPSAFLVAYSGRLTNQKGLTLLIEAMKHLLPERTDIQFIILGGGDDIYRQKFSELASQFPKQLGLHLLPNFKLPRKIFSGADAVLLPSLFEPGGIVALEALRYGSVPIVRRTGGLNDIVINFDAETKKGNGFSFVERDPWALYGAIVEAQTIYRNEKLWNQLVRNCLKADFSWEHAAKEYYTWYRRALTTRKREISSISFGNISI